MLDYSYLSDILQSKNIVVENNQQNTIKEKKKSDKGS
jgi:hypothetical protein